MHQAKLPRRRTPIVSCLVSNLVPSLTFITVGGVGQTSVMELGFSVARRVNDLQTKFPSSGWFLEP
jgi:hypothetical protein